MRTEDEINEQLRTLDRTQDNPKYILGQMDALRWVLEEGPGYSGYET